MLDTTIRNTVADSPVTQHFHEDRNEGDLEHNDKDNNEISFSVRGNTDYNSYDLDFDRSTRRMTQKFTGDCWARTRIYECDAREGVAFVRLIEEKRESVFRPVYGDYSVVNQSVLEMDIRARDALEKARRKGLGMSEDDELAGTLDEKVAKLKAETQWHEAREDLRYCVLAASETYEGQYKRFFEEEKSRIKNGVSHVEAELQKCGAAREKRGWHMPLGSTEDQNAEFRRALMTSLQQAYITKPELDSFSVLGTLDMLLEHSNL